MKPLLLTAGLVSILAGLLGGPGAGMAFVMVGLLACAIVFGG